MSLFPAYSSAPKVEDLPQSAETPGDANASWLVNPSFEKVPVLTTPAPEPDTPVPAHNQTPDASNDDEKSTSKRSHKKSKKDPGEDSDSDRKSRHSKKKKRRHERNERPAAVEPQLEFTGREEYYVDKKSERGFFHVQTLHRPACPKYRSHSRPLAPLPRRFIGRAPMRRYYAKSRRDKVACGDATDVPTNDRLDEEEFVSLNRDYNQRLGTHPDDIDTWLKFVRHQEQTPQKLSKLLLAERKMDILNKALSINLDASRADGCDRLYAEYATVIEAAFPSFEVSKILEGLLAKNPTNYTLWNAQIMASQGSMARCVVPDVLKLYEQCMKHMYNRHRYDEVMLKLFTNCCFFLRQSGLAEQLFALIKLTLDLNVRSGQFSRIQPNEADQPVLVEYEEVILASGLPMNEIWLRIEKLRQNFNFLPCPEDRSCPDPQRIVYNEDVVHFVYPLAQRDFAFDLVVRVLHILKVPLPLQRHEHAAQFDAIEYVLAVLLRKTLTVCDPFDDALIELVRDFSCGPTFVRTHLGHEIYTGVQTELLLLCAEALPQHRRILETLWLRFERIRLRLERSLTQQPVATERAKMLRSQVKSLLKRPENRNELRFYTEYAMIELELGEPDKMEAIFRAAIAQNGFAEAMVDRTEVAHVCVALAEMLMRSRNFSAAIAVLCALALGDPQLCTNSETKVPDYRKLQAMRQLGDTCREHAAADREVTEMRLEQHFGDDPTCTWAKASVYLVLMVRTKAAAVDELVVLLRGFPEANDRHRFLRERLYEVYADVVQMVDKRGADSNLLVFDVLQRGLAEFPDNLVLVRFAAMLQGQTWFRIRTLLTQHQSAVAVVFLVAAAKFRYARYHTASNTDVARIEFGAISSDIDANELTFKTRVCNLLRNCTGNKSSELRRNALLWRIYLRSLVDVKKTFEESRDALFAALDECPWNKSLYLDGSVYAPQQVTHIQDLIIEKQLRICALPEELEILRSDDPLAGTAAGGSTSLASIIKLEPV